MKFYQTSKKLAYYKDINYNDPVEYMNGYEEKEDVSKSF